MNAKLEQALDALRARFWEIYIDGEKIHLLWDYPSVDCYSLDATITDLDSAFTRAYLEFDVDAWVDDLADWLPGSGFMYRDLVEDAENIQQELKECGPLLYSILHR